MLTVHDWDEADPAGALIKKIFRAPGSSSSQHHSSGSHGIQHPRPEAAQPLASDGEGNSGGDTVQPLATGGDGDGGSDTAQPLASAGNNTRHAGRKQLQMSYFFRA